MEVKIEGLRQSEVENWMVMQLVRGKKTGVIVLVSSLSPSSSSTFSGIVVSKQGGNFDEGHFSSEWRKTTFERLPSDIKVILRNI